MSRTARTYVLETACVCKSAHGIVAPKLALSHNAVSVCDSYELRILNLNVHILLASRVSTSGLTTTKYSEASYQILNTPSVTDHVAQSLTQNFPDQPAHCQHNSLTI